MCIQVTAHLLNPLDMGGYVGLWVSLVYLRLWEPLTPVQIRAGPLFHDALQTWEHHPFSESFLSDYKSARFTPKNPLDLLPSLRNSSHVDADNSEIPAEASPIGTKNFDMHRDDVPDDFVPVQNVNRHT